MANIVDFDHLVFDRVLDAYFDREGENGRELIAFLDQVTNFSVNTTSESKDKTDAQGALIKRYYTAKNVEVSGENAVFSLDLAAIQSGQNKLTGTDVTLPRIYQTTIPATGGYQVTLPDNIDPDTVDILVYGVSANGLVNRTEQYTKAASAAEGKYAAASSGGTTKLTFAADDAGKSIQIQYEYRVTNSDVIANRVNQDGKSFPRECQATFRVLCSDVCDPETVLALYIVFPRFLMSPDVEITFDTESTQSFSATAMKDYCGDKQLLYYIAIADDSDEYDVKDLNA